MNGGNKIIAIGTASEQAEGSDEILLTEEVRDSVTAESTDPLSLVDLQPADEAGETYAAQPVTDEPAWDAEDYAPSPRNFENMIRTAALGAVAVWTGLFMWAKLTQLSAPDQTRDWIGMFGDWAVPVALICLVWLLAMRNSTREASRFGAAARMLSMESERLEGRLITVNRELSLAREFIAAQSRDIESLGRVAADRLSQNADRLQSLIKENGTKIDAIGSVSEAALDNMEKLRGQLPVIANSSKDVTNNIANAGRVAHAQIQEMISGFKRLNEFGQSSERQMQAIRGAVTEFTADFSSQVEHFDDIAVKRFAALAEKGAEVRAQLDQQEADALAGIRARAAALADELEQSRQMLDRHEAESITSLRARLTALRDESGNMARALRDSEGRAFEEWQGKLVQFDEELDRRRSEAQASGEAAFARITKHLAAIDSEIANRSESFEKQNSALSAYSENLNAQLSQFQLTMGEIAATGSDTEERVATGLKSLTERLAASQTVLVGSTNQIAELTHGSVRLLELIQASAKHSETELPQAIAASEALLNDFESRLGKLRELVDEASSKGEGLAGSFSAAEGDLRKLVGEVDGLQARLGAAGTSGRDSLSELREALTELDQQTSAFTEKSRGELTATVEQLTLSAREAVAGIEQMSTSAIANISQQIGAESAAAIEQAIQQHTAQAIADLGKAATAATGAGREAAVQLRDQLTKVNELAGNLEHRVAHARQRAEEQVDNEFARRVALITEALNSNAIDIARAIDSDVSDTAWASYLKGDRGIFTRRAVSLIETGEAKAIAQTYESDAEFREHVSRYIHDFEAMLRQVLSTRDGHALGVTLLSADMGKLYVALAQGIERLRS